MDRIDAIKTVSTAASSTSQRCQVSDLFAAVTNVIDRYELTSLKPMATACASLESDRVPLDVAVLGQFKSGKSSLLNALIGNDLLPVGVTAVTAVITRLVAGNSVSVRITELDGKVQSVTPERIGEFVSETDNPANCRKVSAVDVETPALLEWPGLRLVDTPGLGSTIGHNTSVTKDWLPHVAAALVVSSDPPLSEDDCRLIAEVRQLAPHVWITLIGQRQVRWLIRS
jgi:hypothetical protein